MQISDAEWIVMNFVWQNQPVEASDVMLALGAEQKWSDATVKTMLHRLVKKEALATESVGKKFRYRSAVKKQDCVRAASRSFLDRVFGGNAAPALLHFVKEARLSQNEVAELQKLLDSKLTKSKGSKE